MIVVSKSPSLVLAAMTVASTMLTTSSSSGNELGLTTHAEDIFATADTNPISMFASCVEIRNRLEYADASLKQTFPAQFRSRVDHIVAENRKLRVLIVPVTEDSEGFAWNLHATLSMSAGDSIDVAKGHLAKPRKRSVRTTMLGVIGSRTFAAAGRKVSPTRTARVVPNDGEEVDLFDNGEEGEHAAAAIAAEQNEKAKDYLPPSTLLSFFVEALTHNSKVKARLLQRRFEFLTVLESAGDLTGPEFSHSASTAPPPLSSHRGVGKSSRLSHRTSKRAGVTTRGISGGRSSQRDSIWGRISWGGGGDDGRDEGGDSSVRVTWDAVVARMVSHAVANTFNDDPLPVVRAMVVLRSHVLKSRSSADGTRVLGVGSLGPERLEAYRVKQRALNAAGATTVALRAISTHHGTSSQARRVASGVELLQELLSSGNVAVQASVCEYMVDVDKDAHLLKHLRLRLGESLTSFRERNVQLAENGYVALGREQVAAFEAAGQTARLLQSMMEGHHTVLQNLLREQPMNPANVDLIALLVEMLKLQVSG